MKSKVVFSSFLFAVNFCYGQAIDFTTAPFSIGETISFNSSILEEERQLNIYLPASYHPDSSKTYPVIYLLDGSKDEDFVHIAGLVQFASFPWIKTLPESIVVGIANVDRKHDFTFPSTDPKMQEFLPTAGGSKAFIEFITNEVQPTIRKVYPINENKTLIGQSLGGLLATEILIKYPDLFDQYIIVSPSLWWDHESLLKMDWTSSITSKKIFIGVGKEGKVMERVAKALHDQLKMTLDGTNTLHFQFFENRDHGDALHEAVYTAFELLFTTNRKN